MVVSLASRVPFIVAVEVSTFEASFVCGSGTNLTVVVSDVVTVPVSFTTTLTLGIEAVVEETILRSPIKPVALFE